MRRREQERLVEICGDTRLAVRNRIVDHRMTARRTELRDVLLLRRAADKNDKVGIVARLREGLVQPAPALGGEQFGQVGELHIMNHIDDARAGMAVLLRDRRLEIRKEEDGIWIGGGEQLGGPLLAIEIKHAGVRPAEPRDRLAPRPSPRACPIPIHLHALKPYRLRSIQSRGSRFLF
jgi:hypothetical protein